MNSFYFLCVKALKALGGAMVVLRDKKSFPLTPIPVLINFI